MERNIYEWYVVYTRQGMEMKVSKELQKKNIESYCPVNKVQNKWWTLKKSAGRPLFSSCVFVKIDEKDVAALKKINGVVNVLYWLGKPAVVKEQEIHMIKDFLCNHTNVKVEKTSIKNLNYTYGATERSVASYKIELPTLGYRVVAGKPEQVKVVSIKQAHQTAELTPKQQYSNAG